MAPIPENLQTKEVVAKFLGYFPDLAMTEMSMKIPSYAKETKYQFMQYFYPTEQMVVRSNNFERLFNRPEADKPYFENLEDIDRYCEDLKSDSSHTEDRPTVSECEFLDSDVGPEYMHQEYYLDRIMHWTRFRPTFTKAKRRLLLNLSRVMVAPQDNEKTYMLKRNKRLQLIREYCKELKRKRFARVYKRYSKIRTEYRMPITEQAQYLLDAELKDKGLYKHKLYPGQPKAYIEFLNNRMDAIVKKFSAYVDDPIFRDIYINRVYYNTSLSRKIILTLDNIPIFEPISEAPTRLDTDHLRHEDGEVYIRNMSPQQERVFQAPLTPRAVLPPSSPSNQQAPIEDDNVASSEEEFISEYDEHPHTPGWSKPMTANKSEFLVKLNQLKALPGREGHMESQLLIHDYTERNRYRRNYKAYERLVDVLRQSLPTPEEQSQVLEAQELSDKQLDRNFYYSNDEPKEYTILLQKRQRSIQRKYQEYAQSQEFRDRYQKRILAFKPKMELRSPI